MTKIIKHTILKKHNLFFLIVPILILSSAFVLHKQDPKLKVRTIVIDPGHGGKDPGCSGINHNEKDVALAVALKLGKYIEENMKDVKVIFTRKTDVFVELDERANIANDAKADLFISIHCNAAGKPVMVKDSKTGKMHKKTYKNKKGKIVVVETANPIHYGAETYVMGLKNEEGKMKVAQRENSAILLEDNYEKKYQGFDPDSEESYIIMSNYTSAYVIQSAGLAIKIQDEYAKKASRVDKGVHRQSIWVLWRTAMPSVLTEIGYLTNPQEEQFLGSTKGQEYMAACLFRAFRKYKDEVEGTKKIYNDEFENQKVLDKELHLDEKIEAKNDPEEKIEIVKIDSTDIIKERKRKLDNEKNYNTLLTNANTYFKNKEYEKAKTTYEKAIDLKTENNNESKSKLAEIETILQKQADEKVRLNEQKEVNKNELIKKYKEKAFADSLAKANIIKPLEVKVVNDNTISFRIQFATTDKEVDAASKYSKVTDVWFYKLGASYKYTSGNFKKFEDAAKHQLKLKELGYNDCFVAAFKNGARMDINEAKKLTN